MNKLNILIPISGNGNRFKQLGYTDPKPLIIVKNNKRMIELVLENINYKNANYIFIVKQDHLDNYNLKEILEKHTNNPTIIPVSTTTEGAACSALLAKDYINNKNPLFIINGDQYVEMNFENYFNQMFKSNCDGNIITFELNTGDKKWSYVKLNEQNLIIDVKEKECISNLATIGCYYWSNGTDFVSSAEEMINNKEKSNGEYYICPTYINLIKKNKRITSYEINANKFHGLGTPEDLNLFIYKNII